MSKRYSIDWLLSLGFDRSTKTFGRPGLFSVACSQCQAAVINGIPCHEQGCPNARKIEEDRRARRAKGVP